LAPALLAAAASLIALTAIAPAHAAELPQTFLGDWTKDDGDLVIGGINVGSRSYREPGYNCDIKSITDKDDLGGGSGLAYVVNMTCKAAQKNARTRKVREIWALRKIDGKYVLIMAGIAGETYPSIGLLQRCKDRADTGRCTNM